MKILLAVDGSQHSDEAIRAIAGRPWPENTSVRVLHAIPVYTVLPPVAEPLGVEMGAVTDLSPVREESLKLLASAAEPLRAAGLPVETVVVEGDPRAAILDDAESWGADLIVVGSHGYTGFTRWLLGSVAQSVVAHAPCSVEVVRQKRAGTAAEKRA